MIDVDPFFAAIFGAVFAVKIIPPQSHFESPPARVFLLSAPGEMSLFLTRPQFQYFPPIPSSDRGVLFPWFYWGLAGPYVLDKFPTCSQVFSSFLNR